MLPTSGYFRGVSCPDYEKGRCHRPFCHFHHHPRRDMPTCSKSETSPKKGENAEEASDTETSEANSSNQSELLQQLVSDAVKKALSENPLLAAAGVDPSSVMKKIDTSALIAQASAEVGQTKTKKKLYLRPPDTPSYNPTPIEELNKRKRSIDSNDKEGAPSKVMKYVPSNLSASSVISDVLEGEINTKSSADSDATDFSSDDGEGHKRRDDFDILEEVLAEHSQNNKIKVKKKKVRALSKLQYNLNSTEKISKNSTVISDAQFLSDPDSSSCDTSKKNSTESHDIEEKSYFLPPSPVFTSSSDGFGMFNSTVYTTSKTDSESCKTSENVPAKEEKEVKEKEEKEVTPVKVSNAIQKSEVIVDKAKEKPSKEEVKNKSKGHSLLPQVVHTLSAPKISRRNIRNWTPQVRSTLPEVKEPGDPLEEILQLMDGEDSQQTESKEDSKKTTQKVESSKIVKKYKVDLDKEILSLANLSSNKEEIQPPPAENLSEEKLEISSTNSNEKQKLKNTNQGESSKEEQIKKLPDMETKAKDSQSEKKERKSESESEDPDQDSEDEEDDPEKDENPNKETKGDVSAKDDESSDSEHRRGRHRRKRKRDRSSSSDSEHSYHRRRKKKSHKRRRKYSHSKKKRKRHTSRDDSDEDDGNDSNRDEEDSADEKSDASRENSQDDEIDKIKRHKKHKKRGKHHKKYKYKRRRSKSKKKRNRSHSSSRSSSRSSSESRSRSRSHSRSRSESRDRSQSKSRSRSRSRSLSKRKNRRESEDKLKRRNSTGDSQENTKDKTKALSVPMPVDPSKIKIEKEATVPDLSIVKIEKDLEQTSYASGKKEEDAGHSERKSSSETSTKQDKSSHSKPINDISTKEREKVKQGSDKEHKKSRQDRKSSTDSMSDKSQRRQSTDSKKSENEDISGSSKHVSKRRVSEDSFKKENTAQDSQGKVMSMFDMVVASTQKAQPSKILKEISIFDAGAGADNNCSEDSTGDDVDSTEPFLNDDLLTQKSDTLSKSKSGQSSKVERSVDRSSSQGGSVSLTSSSSRKDDKNESKRKHSSSTSKEKSSSHKSSSSHHSSSSSKHKSSSNSSKHSSTAVSSSTSSSKETHSSKTKEKSGVTSSSHSSGSTKHHSSKHSSSSKSQKSSSSTRKHSSGSHSKEREHSSRSSKTEGKIKESSRSKRYSTDNEASNGIFDRESCNDGSDSPLPDLSALDEIPQDDWEQMINSSVKYDLQHLENLNDNDEDYDLDDLDKDDPTIMEECMRMFNEYQPEESQPQTSSKKTKAVPKEEPESHSGKQRIARSSTGNLVAKKPEKGPRRSTPAQVMMERYQKLKEQQAELMKQLKKQKQQLDEQNRGRSSSSSAVSSTTSSRPSTFPASSSTSVKSPPMSSSGGSKRRISHVPNVSSLLHAREKIKNLPPTKSRTLLSPSVAKASGNLPQTIAHTVTKGGRRTAHIPQSEALSRPIIPAEFGSKVPQNIRQRYLNSFIDECLKFSGEKTAFRIAMAEERVCYNRASSRMVYLNLAVNTLKRLRTQQSAGEAAQELIDSDPQFGESSELDEPSTSTKPSSSISTPSPSKTASQHPINPNHVRLSHFSVLAVGGQKGSWSIEKPKKNSADLSDCLKGVNFYKYMKKYLLTEEQLHENGYPLPDPNEKGKAIIAVRDTRKKLSPSAVERYCDRCSLLYKVDKWGFPTTTGPCVYHWGRAYKRRGYSGLETRYSCCGGDLESDGCVQATTHVSQNYNPDDLRGYVRTLPKESSSGDYGVYALDCEMCYTTAGNELTRVTVINSEGKSVYEQLVKPENPIIDYNTRFSGITESDMEDVRTTIFDVQAALLTRFSDKTILVGHSLESDFHALKLIHDTVVDTSVVFPHKMGHPYKRALRNLASEILKRIIQNDVSGHDSAEDAVTCMHLMQWKIKEDLKRIKK
ncbi:biorientation of chromosomes in cell division protein 1-like 1 isoform X2 [Penaeus japonicus]|uniref:biorientation of chromosomes in cell division protein 1-like 1 isoform X2 n=1 Tax=Penaeus japonicus TaxID=27405 RepID=UPI001C7129B6|nr:biorientation of chromosomes in cell division protein 1-like 1 isoform X2 [Penaeus japonicus]